MIRNVNGTDATQKQTSCQAMHVAEIVGPRDIKDTGYQAIRTAYMLYGVQEFLSESAATQPTHIPYNFKFESSAAAAFLETLR